MDKIKELLQAAIDELEKTNVVEQKTRPRQYVPENGEEYFYILPRGEVSRERWDRYSIDRYRLEIGDVYRTEEEAQKVVDRKKLIHELWQEEGVLLEPDWGDENQLKYYLYYSYYLAKWVKSNHMLVQSQFELPHFESKEAVEAIIEKYGSRLDVLL